MDGGVVGMNGEGAHLRVVGQAVGDTLPFGVAERSAEHSAGADGVAFAGDADVDVGLVVSVGGHGVPPSQSFEPLSDRYYRLYCLIIHPIRGKDSIIVQSNLEQLQENSIYCGDARKLLKRISPNAVDLSFWSPPYFVGKSYEKALSFDDWQELLCEVISLHFDIVKPGGFLAVNIADILAFPDPEMPRIQADNVSSKKVKITREQVLEAQAAHPAFNRYQLADLLGCSEQTIDRRLNNNNVRGGKYAVQRKVKLVGGLVEEWADKAGFYLYDRRVWVKDACWENSRWHSLSYRSVDEFE